MKNILTLPIDQTTKIQISVPETDKKINYFYLVSDSLHKFDEATVEYIYDNEPTTLKADALGAEILEDLIYSLNEILDCGNELFKKIKLGRLGFAWCEFAENLPDDPKEYPRKEDIFTAYWLLSGIGVQTWLYTVNKKIILEISPSYAWYFEGAEKKEGYITYQEFIKNYKPIAVVELSKETVMNWLKKCQELLDKLKND